MKKLTSRAAIAGGITLALVLAPVAASAADLEETLEETVAVEEIEVVEEATVETEPEAEVEVIAEEAPEVAPTAVMADAVGPLVSVDGLKPLGIIGIKNPPVGSPESAIEFDRFMPQPRNAHIKGLAKPETSEGVAPDEVRLDLRSLAPRVWVRGDTGESYFETGFEYNRDGVLVGRSDTGERAPWADGDFGETLDWAEYTWRFNGIGAVNIIDTSAVDGAVTLVPFAEGAEYGVEATLVHSATGVEAEPIRITGFSGFNSGRGFDWVYGDQRSFDGGTPIWEHYDESKADHRHLSWRNPHEVISPTGAPEIRSNTPSMAPGLRGDDGFVGQPDRFGLWNTDGHLQAGISMWGMGHRIGQLHGEPVERVVFDLADSIPGATAVALPDGPTGVLSLEASPIWERYTRFAGLDYQAPTGLTFEVSGTVVTATFGSAEWVNSFGIVVPVLVNGAVQWAEIRSENLPRDIAGGIVSKSIPVNTELLVTDTELLEASRLTGLSPSLAEVQAAELPEGVERVANGFVYQGSEEPTQLAFGFTVAETVETAFGPVVPDSSGDGEVRIAVFAEGEVPVDPEVPTPETPAPEKPAVVTPPKAGPNANPGANTGDEQAAAAAAEQRVENGVAVAILGAFGAVALALSFLGGWVLGRRKTAPVTADEA